MGTTTTNVTTQLVKYKCDECNTVLGDSDRAIEWNNGGTTALYGFGDDSIQYVYTCPNCNTEVTLSELYPHIEYT